MRINHSISTWPRRFVRISEVLKHEPLAPREPYFSESPQKIHNTVSIDLPYYLTYLPGSFQSIDLTTILTSKGESNYCIPNMVKLRRTADLETQFESGLDFPKGSFLNSLTHMTSSFVSVIIRECSGEITNTSQPASCPSPFPTCIYSIYLNYNFVLKRP